MTVRDALEKRVSVRCFLPQEPSLDLVRDILEAAARAPSGGNLQPWRVYVLTGSALADLKAAMTETFATANSMRDVPKEPADYQIYPPDLTAPYSERRIKCAQDMYAAASISRDDKTARLDHFKRNFQFFDAPVGLVFTIDRQMGPPQWSDLGMYMQSVMLLAVEEGLGTCAQEAWSMFPQTLSRHAGIPANEMIFAGMALGFVDNDAPINRARMDRASLDEFVTFVRG